MLCLDRFLWIFSRRLLSWCILCDVAIAEFCRSRSWCEFLRLSSLLLPKIFFWEAVDFTDEIFVFLSSPEIVFALWYLEKLQQMRNLKLFWPVFKWLKAVNLSLFDVQFEANEWNLFNLLLFFAIHWYWISDYIRMAEPWKCCCQFGNFNEFLEILWWPLTFWIQILDALFCFCSLLPLR